MRKKVLVGNWKMHKLVSDAKQFAKQSVALTVNNDVQIGVAPTFLSLKEVKKANEQLIVLSQNVHFEDKGAFTGEISIEMLKDVHVDGSLVGHSERRTYNNEDNVSCNKKVKKLLTNDLIALYCVGETLSEYEQGMTKAIISEQIRVGLAGLVTFDAQQLIIAYEPVWSIGTGINASKEIAEEIIAFIREILEELFSKQVADQIRILYGGSVKPDNIKDYLSMPNIDGALVGGASLAIESFQALIEKSC